MNGEQVKIQRAEISRVQMAMAVVPIATEERSSWGHTCPPAPMAVTQCRLQWITAEHVLWCGAVEISVDAVILATALEVKDTGNITNITSMCQNTREPLKEQLEEHILNFWGGSVFQRTCWDRTRKILMLIAI